MKKKERNEPAEDRVVNKIFYYRFVACCHKDLEVHATAQKEVIDKSNF